MSISPSPVRRAFPAGPAAGFSTNPNHESAQGLGGLGLGRVVEILKLRWWMVVAAGLLALSAAWYLVPELQTVYRAGAVVRLADARRALTGNLDGGLMDNLQGPDDLTSQMHVLRSRGVTGAVVDRVGLRLHADPVLGRHVLAGVTVDSAAAADSLWFRFAEGAYTVRDRSGEVRAGYGFPAQLGGVTLTVLHRPDADSAAAAVLPRDLAIDLMLQGLWAGPRDRSAIIDLGYVSADPLLAQQVVNAVAEEYRDHNTGRVREQAVRRREFIADRLVEAETKLEEAEFALSSFRSQGRLYSSRDRMLAEQSSLMQLEVRREEIDADRRMARTLLARMEQAREGTFDQELRTLVAYPSIASNAVISQLFNLLNQHQLDRQRLLADGRSESHPEVVRATSLIASTRTELVNAVRSHISSLDVRLTALDDLRGRSASTIRDLPEAETQETRLTQEVATARRMTDLLRDELQRAELAVAVEVGQVEILDLASFAMPQPSGRRNQKLGLALVFGLLLGSGGALLIEVTNTSIRRRDELEDSLAIPGLAVIPQIGPVSNGGKSWKSGGRRAGQARGASEPGVRGLVTAEELQSAGAEAYRQLRTNLYYSQPAERLRTLVVSSAVAGEGKTTTAANLAVTFARQGMRVLLVDTDLRRPRLHHVFGIEREPGFTDCLFGRAAPVEAIRETSIERLHVMPRGTFDADAIEMLNSDRTRQLLNLLAERFEVVILDTPPVLVAADAAVLGAMTDGVLLVVRAGSTKRDDARHALGQLAAVGARVVGSVLNDADSTAERYGEYYYRHYQEYAVSE